MNRDYLKQIMIDQKETYLNNPMIKRDYPLEDNVNYCFVGIRRTGKSYMMYQQIKHLQENGIPLKQIVYVNFEDERLLELSADDLNLILKSDSKCLARTINHIFFWMRFKTWKAGKSLSAG